MSERSLAQPARDESTQPHARWAAIRQRTTRGLLLYNSGPTFAHLEGHLWAVRASEGGWWHVDLEEEACSCPDYEYFGSRHGVPCKHVYAVAMAHATRRSGVRVRTITAAGDPFKAAGSRRLWELRDRYQHELMDDDERQELRDTIRRMRGGRA